MRLLAALLPCLLLPALASAAEVVATIRPVHSIVAGVMRGVGEPVLLMEGGASPHTYTLRPSDARALAAADVVVMVGGGLEGFLDKPLRNLAKDAEVIRWIDLPGATVLPARAGGAWEQHEEHDDRHDHGEAGLDTHLWLDAANAKVLAAAVADALSRRDPANAATYTANARALSERLDGLDREIEAMLEPVRGRPFLVFHDAYQYFEKRYGVPAAGSVTVSPDRQPGARRVAEIRRRMAEAGAACLFREPQFSPRLVERLGEGAGVRVGVLDPLGADLPAGPDQYFATLRGLAAGLAECLKGG